MTNKQLEQANKLSIDLDRAYESEEEHEDDWELYPAAAFTIKNLLNEIHALKEYIKNETKSTN